MPADVVEAPIAPPRSFTRTVVLLFEKACHMMSKGLTRTDKGTIGEAQGVDPPICLAMPLLLERPRHTVVKPSARAATVSLPVERPTVVKPLGVMPLGTREFAVIQTDSADFRGVRPRLVRPRLHSTDWTVGLRVSVSQPSPASGASKPVPRLPRSISLTDILVLGNDSGQKTRHFSKSLLLQSRQIEANELRNFVHRRRETQRIRDD